MTRVPDSVLSVLVSAPTISRVMGASRRRILTTLMLSPPDDALDLIGWFRREIVSGRFSPDPAIIFSLFRALDRKRKVSLAASACGSALDTPNFMKLISKVYRTCSPRGLERTYLAQAISRHASFYRNISTRAYEKLVRSMLNSRFGTERSQGTLCVGSLSNVDSDLCLRLAELVRDPLFYVRSNAWFGANALLYQGRLSEEACQSLLRDSLAAIKDKDKTLRGNARIFRQRTRQKLTRRPTVSPSRRSRPSLSVGLT